MSERCEYCHKDPAEGFATIDGERYCHGDGPGPSCYELAPLAKRVQQHKMRVRLGLLPGDRVADRPAFCSCGDRTRPNINHRKRIPCWTYHGPDRYDIDADGRLVGWGDQEEAG